MKKRLHKVFLIAGSEPLGSAGMQADIKAITACGGYAACALTGIVDEDTTRVKSITPLPADLVVIAKGFTGAEQSVLDAFAAYENVHVAGDARMGSTLVATAMADALRVAQHVADELRAL